jgi:hypothetical protein
VFQDFYYPQITAKPLEFGVAYHKAMECYYDPETWWMTKKPETHAVLVNNAVMTIQKVIQEQYDEYVNNFGDLDTEVKADYLERVELGIGMLKYHLRDLAPTIDKNLTPIKVEIPFEVPIVNPENDEQLWCQCAVCFSRYSETNQFKEAVAACELEHEAHGSYHTDEEDLRAHFKGLPVTLGGRIDALMEDELGNLWVFDWKTAAMLSDRKDFLLVEDQVTSYLWAMYVLGIACKGFIYHEQRKAYPVEPEPMKNRRLGRLFSTNKSNAYQADLYRQTVSELDTYAYERGLYDEFLQYLEEEGSNFYGRYNVPRTEQEIINAGQSIFDEAWDMTSPTLRVYPTPGRFSCSNCAFQTPCVEKNRGGDYTYALDTLYDKRRYHYWEDALPSTENEGRLVGA